MNRLRFGLLALLLMSCSSPSLRHFDASDYSSNGRVMRGQASWYTSGWFSHRTASGERFNPDDFTAAHRTLPFGTVVRVTNLRNHRSVMVEITDRGPRSHRRLIDVSEAAAEELGMIESGVAPVEIQILRARASSR